MDRPDVEPHSGRRGRGRGRVLFDLRPVRLEQVDRHLTRRSAARRAVLGALGGQPSARQPCGDVPTECRPLPEPEPLASLCVPSCLNSGPQLTDFFHGLVSPSSRERRNHQIDFTSRLLLRVGAKITS